jgi:parvulin-like peptidyl-prolyl isomerase
VIAGALATACTVTPRAASVNGSTISTSSLDTQLQVLDGTQAGQCLLEAETGQLIQTQGAGGSGTFDMGFADSILQNSVTNMLADQLATAKGLTVTTAALATATTDFHALLNGEINAAAQQALQTQAASYCVSSTGQALTASAVLAAVPADISAELVHNYAVDTELLADGANITNAQIVAYYRANQALFTTDCVSAIVASTQANAAALLNQIKAGASFASVAKANSLDAQSAAAGGSLGCTFTKSQVEQALSIPSYTVGSPIGPIQDSTTGAWELYMVSSQSVAPLSSAVPDIRRQLLQSPANGNRVAKEIVAFAHRSNIYVDPQYGTWTGHTLAPPPPPPVNLLQAAAGGASAKALAPAGSTGRTGRIGRTGG